ncbi:MAG: YesL family protein [Lachnospiraceae bacterium]|nr:YesL family protein [Lachnospiraceae bacterium]
MKENSKAERFFSYDGVFYEVCEKLFDMLAVSIYWLIGCLPVVTIGTSFTALYYTASHSIRCDIKTVTTAFWTSFRQNFVEGLKLWLVVFAGMFVFLLNIGILDEKMFNNVGIGLMVFYGFCFVAVLAMACYAFPALSRFDEPAGWIVKVSLYMMVKNFPVTLLLLLMLAGCYIAVFYVPFLILILPGFASSISTFLVEPILKKHMPEENQNPE